jgi:hypothetical protein
VTNASDVSVYATGEVVEADVQAQLEAFDRATSSNERIDDLQIAVTLVDDFMSGTAQSGKIGKLRWTSEVTNDGQVTRGGPYSEPGVLTLDTGANGAAMLRLGKGTIGGNPLFVCEMRVKLDPPVDTQGTCWIGLHNGTVGLEPKTGFFFRHGQLGDHWEAVCSYQGTARAYDTGVPADDKFHRFRITCDGAEWGGSSIARFYIDAPEQQPARIRRLPSSGLGGLRARVLDREDGRRPQQMDCDRLLRDATRDRTLMR